MPSWELTLAEVRGMSMPLAPDSMTEEKWAKLKAAQNNTSSTETYLLVHDLIPSILAYHKHAEAQLAELRTIMRLAVQQAEEIRAAAVK